MDNNYQQQYQNVPQTIQYSNQVQVKPKGINLYSIPLFDIYNPKNAMVNFTINTKTNDLTIIMTPAIPNNAAINVRGPVPKDTKVYDHSKKVNSTITYVELIDLISLLKRKFIKNSNQYESNITNNTILLNEIKSNLSQLIQNNLQFAPQYNELIQNINNKLDIIIQQNNQILNKNNQPINTMQHQNSFNNENTFSMYRTTENGSKSWLFTYDPQIDKLYINLTVKSNNTIINKMSTAISSDMGRKLLNALESYLNNFSTNSILANFAYQLSETLLNNNILAPRKN